MLSTEDFWVRSVVIGSNDISKMLSQLSTPGGWIELPTLPQRVFVPPAQNDVTLARWGRHSNPFGAEYEMMMRTKYEVAVLQYYGHNPELDSQEQKDLKAKLDESSVRLGYDDFRDLVMTHIGQPISEAQYTEIAIGLPLGLELTGRHIAKGRVELDVRCLPPLNVTCIRAYVTEDRRWSDDVDPLEQPKTRKQSDGWTAAVFHLPQDQLTDNSHLWVRYEGDPVIPRTLVMPIGLSPYRRALLATGAFVYGSHQVFAKAVNAEGEKLEAAVLNAVASLGLVAFYGGSAGGGPQKPARDVVGVDGNAKRAAVIEVTSGAAHREARDKRPQVVESARTLSETLPKGWTVTPVLAVRGPAGSVDQVERGNLYRVSVVLWTNEDLQWLLSDEASLSGLWRRIDRNAPMN